MDSYTATPSAAHLEPSKPKSLQDISAAKTLQVLQSDENAIDTLLELDDERRQVLLPHLWQDYLRLLAIEQKYNAAQQRIPAADRHICFHDAAEDARTQGNNAEPDVVEYNGLSQIFYPGNEDSGQNDGSDGDEVDVEDDDRQGSVDRLTDPLCTNNTSVPSGNLSLPQAFRNTLAMTNSSGAEGASTKFSPPPIQQDLSTSGSFLVLVMRAGVPIVAESFQDSFCPNCYIIGSQSSSVCRHARV